MTAITTRPAEITLPATFPARIAARIATAIARARARRAYRQLLEREDHVLSDMGLSRREVRKALIECGGRP